MKTERGMTPGLVLVIAVLCISSSSILIRFSSAPSSVIAFYRLLYAALIHGVLSLRNRKAYVAVDRTVLLQSVIAGAFLALHFLLWISSLQYTTVASSTVLVSFHPIFTALGGYWLYRERLTRRGGVAIAVALAGTLIIASGGLRGAAGVLYGDGLALGGALAVAVYLLLGRGVRQRLDTLPYTTMVYGASTLLLAMVMVVQRTPFMGYSARDHLLFLAMAVLPTLLGHTLLNWSLAYVPAVGVSAAALGEPVAASTLAFFLLAETPTRHQWVGGVLVLLGLAIFAWSRRTVATAGGRRMPLPGSMG